MARQPSLNFFDIVGDLAAVPDLDCSAPEPIVFEPPAPQRQDSSGVSSNMDIEAHVGTAESTRRQAPSTLGSISWAGDTGCFAGRSFHSALFHGLDVSQHPLVSHDTPPAPVPSSHALPATLLSQTMAEDEVFNLQFCGVVDHAVKEEPPDALDPFLHKGEPDAVDQMGSPLLRQFGSHDSITSALGLENTCAVKHTGITRSDGACPPLNSLSCCQSAGDCAPGLPATLTSTVLSFSVPQLKPQLKLAYSQAGPGTNRPPKEGSLSAKMPSDKLQRKRAAARRYYHNQKNKVVDYEATISKLEMENQTLSLELMNALKRLEMLKKSNMASSSSSVLC